MECQRWHRMRYQAPSAALIIRRANAKFAARGAYPTLRGPLDFLCNLHRFSPAFSKLNPKRRLYVTRQNWGRRSLKVPRPSHYFFFPMALCSRALQASDSCAMWEDRQVGIALVELTYPPQYCLASAKHGFEPCIGACMWAAAGARPPTVEIKTSVKARVSLLAIRLSSPFFCSVFNPWLILDPPLNLKCWQATDFGVRSSAQPVSRAQVPTVTLLQPRSR